MKKIIYHKGYLTIYATPRGVAVRQLSAYDTYQDRISYYTDYPTIPENWSAAINEYNVTEAMLWLHDLDMYIPYYTRKV